MFLSKMKFKLFVFIFLFLRVMLNAQVTATALTPTQLVQNVLLGAGVTASNITYTGYANAISQFTATPSTNLGISNGVYLTTGSYLQNDPNNPFSGGTDGPLGPASNIQDVDNGEPGNTILDNISGLTTYNAAVLEFDFVPLDDTVSFRYIFASEEYNEYVNSSWNDVFAFILSGVSTPMPPTNIALIPGTTMPVSINNVNNGIDDFITGLSIGPCENCAYFDDNVDEGVNVVYDGLTTILTASSPVICGQTYHIKIMIADGGDGSIDSGVFLEAGSFSSPAAVTVNSTINGVVGDTIAVEGCDQFSLDFVRPSSQIGTAASFSITIGGTAINGLDYSAISGTINFPIGVDTVTYILNPSMDGMVEGTENISITINNITVCGVVSSATYNYYIDDVQQISVIANDTTICPGGNVILHAFANGGSGTLMYSWNGGTPSTNSTYSISPASTTSYSVSVDDNCIGTPPATRTVTVNVVVPYTLTIPNQDTIFCSNETNGLIAAQTNSTSPGIWSGSPQITDNGNNTVSFNPSLLPLGNTNLLFTVGATGCSSSEAVTIIVNPFYSSSFNSIPNLCINSPLVPIIPDYIGGSWYLDNSVFALNSIDPTVIPVGIHSLKHVTGVPSCPDSTTKSFIINDIATLNFNSDTTEGCLSGGNTFSFEAQINPVPGGTGYSLTWTFGDGSFISNFLNPTHTYGTSGDYTVGLNYSDANGCSTSLSKSAYIKVHPQPQADFVTSNNNPSILEPGVYITNLSHGNNDYLWNLNNMPYSIDKDIEVTFDTIGMYSIELIATSPFGCTDSILDYIHVQNDIVVYVPSAFSPNGDGKNDLFFPQASGIYFTKGYKMQIFDRWGEKVFETDNYYNYWNGAKNNGEAKPVEDVYIYRIYYKALDDKTRLKQGSVTIIR